MTTTIFEVTLKDGRIYRVFTANSTQERKAIHSFNNMRDQIETIETPVNGIHTFKQWSEIIPHL